VTQLGAAAAPNAATLTIGDVLAHLKVEFSDLTISKIRFLEGEGLVDIEPRQRQLRLIGVRRAGVVPDEVIGDLPRLRVVIRLQGGGHCTELRRGLQGTLVGVALIIPNAEKHGRADQHTADQPRRVLRYQVLDGFQLFVIGQIFFCHGFSAILP